jgi:hypothetical protein
MSHTVVSGNRVTGIIKTSEDVGACGAALDTDGGGGTLDHVSVIGNTSETVVGSVAREAPAVTVDARSQRRHRAPLQGHAAGSTHWLLSAPGDSPVMVCVRHGWGRSPILARIWFEVTSAPRTPYLASPSAFRG